MAGVTLNQTSSGELPASNNESLLFDATLTSVLLVLLIFLTFLLSSLFCKLSYNVECSFLHPLICFSLFWVAYERSNDFVKKSFD